MDKEKLIYEMFKDTALKSNWFRYILIDRFKLNDKQIANIYARINNYQTKKYGGIIRNYK